MTNLQSVEQDGIVSGTRSRRAGQAN